MSEKPRAGLVRELDTVGIDLQNLDDVGVVGTHHMQTHLRRENQAAALTNSHSFTAPDVWVCTAAGGDESAESE